MKKNILILVLFSIFTHAMQKPQDDYRSLIKEVTQLVDSYRDLDFLVERLKIWFKTPGYEKLDDNPIFMAALLDKISMRFNLSTERTSKLFNTKGSQFWQETKKAQQYQKNIAEQRISSQLSAKEIKNKLLVVYKKSAEAEIIALIKNNPEWASIELNDETPLTIAARRNFINLVKVLIAQGARINKVDKKQATALNNAVSRNHFDLVKLLLSLGADPNIAGYQDQTSLMLAVNAHNMPLAYELIKAGARINKQDYQGNTVLMRAMRNEAPDSTIVFLLDHSTPTDLIISNKIGETALILSIKILKRNDVVQELLNRGAKVTPDVFKVAGDLADNINTKQEILKTLQEKQSNPEKIFRQFKLSDKL